jgi:hydroxymethylpyrimidine kinase/phosphomethylpyrimidine kinase/thiamine-phosphate diphosphorylase
MNASDGAERSEKGRPMDLVQRRSAAGAAKPEDALLLSIAGHDPAGGAGFTADLAAWSARGWRGASVCTALTVQGAAGVQRVQCSEPQLVRDALRSVRAEVPVAAIKLGMLGSGDVLRAVLAELEPWLQACPQLPVVWDPVLAAGAGGEPLLERADGAALDRLARLCSVITPNRDEAAALLGVARWRGAGRPPPDWIDALRARWLRAGRTRAVLLKGGHADGDASVDWLVDANALHATAVARLPDHGRTHGTGCLYAASVAATLAGGGGMLDALVDAQAHTRAAIAGAWRGGARAFAHAAAPLDSASLPALAAPDADPAWPPPPPFAPLREAPGLYVLAPDADTALRLLDWGARTVQLRLKGDAAATPDLRRAQIARVAAAARERGAQLFVNDHWREAIDAGAFGVHLGQEDLDALPAGALAALRAAGLRLGLSSHTPAELARAHALQPSYIACGPLYPTRSKALEHAPLGLRGLREWVARCTPRYPVVAIGGIALTQLGAVAGTGAAGAAVIGAVLAASDPRRALHEGLAAIEQARAALTTD